MDRSRGAGHGGRTEFKDLFRKKKVAKDNSELDDFVIFRRDGTPVFHFAGAIDDAKMGVTHVIRGDDHIANTHKQILLYEALGYPLPSSGFGHVPMINGPDGQKLSKRHGAVSTLAYREEGFLPEAMLNCLARLGWGHGDQEIFSAKELIHFFSLEHVSRSPSCFDLNKLRKLNTHYIKVGDPERIANLLAPFLLKRGIKAEFTPQLVRIVRSLQERAITLEDMAKSAEFYFRAMPADPKAAAKYLTKEAAPMLEEITREFAALEMFSPSNIKETLNGMVDRRGRNLKIHQPIRVAVTGRAESPDLFTVLELLGRDEVVRRLSSTVKDIYERRDGA